LNTNGTEECLYNTTTVSRKLILELSLSNQTTYTGTDNQSYNRQNMRVADGNVSGPKDMKS